MTRCMWIMAIAGLMGAALALGEETAIVEDGEARAVVVIPSDAYPIAEYAAEELVRHVEKATGVALSVVDEGNIPEEPAGRVFVGSTAQAGEAGIDVSALAPEAVVIDVRGGHLFIAAEDGPGDPESESHANPGSLWGVYDVLDRELGVRWLWPGELGTYVPERDSLYVEPGERTVEPRFRWRRLRHGIRNNDPRIGFTEEALEDYREAQGAFLRRHRMNTHDRPPFGHRFGGWWEEYGDEHSEWFKEWDGERGPRHAGRERRVSMCVSNPELRDKVIELWQAELDESSETPFLRLGEADGRGWCHCQDCIAWDAPQPSKEELKAMSHYIARNYFPLNVSDRYARFWRVMHERAAETAPDVRTTAYIYTNYFVAPSEPITFSSNVHLDFVAWGGFWFPRLVEEQEWVRKQWLGWRETGASLSYRPNYFLDGYVMPHVFSRQFADIFQFIERHDAVGTDFDSLKGQWAVQGPLLYLAARIHTRPRASVDELLNEYYQAFGPAAEAVRAYFEYWEAHTTRQGVSRTFPAWQMTVRVPSDVERRGTRIDEIMADRDSSRLFSYARAAHAIFPPASFEPAQEILDEAHEAVAEAPDSEYARRVEFLQVGLDHARMCVELAASFDNEAVPEYERREAYERLVEFRRTHEALFFSNLSHAANIETNSWGDRSGFIGSE